MRNSAALILCLLAALAPGLARGGEADDWPHVKDIKKCPRCSAAYDAAPHPLDYRQCPKCQAALDKAMGYIKKRFKPQFFGLILDSFFGGFAFLCDGGGNHDRDLGVCARNCRDLIRIEPEGGMANATSVGADWCSWKKSMAMYFLTEYSLRHGLTAENKAALIEGAKFAAETQQKGGGWFHSKPKEKQYAPDIAIIGCIFHAAFLEMKALGIDPGPILNETRTYLESISDGKTIGYSKGWRGGMGGGGADGFITLGLLGSGNAGDKWGSGLARWMEQNYMDAGHGHANGELHYFALGAGLHRLGAEHYAKFATCHIHRLIDIQKDDGSMPALSHDISSEDEYFQKLKNEKSAPGEFPATAVLAALILMERPGAFSPLPSKPAGSISNQEAFKLGAEAFAKSDYAKAYKNFALVLPRGDSGELVPQAREEMQKIETLAKQQLETLQTKDAGLSKRAAEKADSRELLAAFAEMIADYEKFQKQFEGTAAAQDARRASEPLQKTLSEKRMRLAFSTGGAPSGGTAPATAAPAPAKLKGAGAQKEWDEKLKERLKIVIASGGKPRFDFKALATRMTIQSFSDNDTMKAVLEKGGGMEVTWTQLQAADRRSLALELASTQAAPADHALAAFYLLCYKQTQRAEEHLDKCGPEAAKVRAAFEQ